MSKELKRYELTLEVNSVEGCQVFACFADSELDAKLKLSRGECEIIEQSLEVVGLDKDPIEVIESDDISSRLPTDLLALQSTELEQLRKERDELRRFVSEVANADVQKEEVDVEFVGVCDITFISDTHQAKAVKLLAKLNQQGE